MAKKILIIQTAFPGDVILATALPESLRQSDPGITIDFLVRKGNEHILEHNPHLRNVLVFDKKKNKLSQLLHLIRRIRSEKYDAVINVQRFASSGILTAFSGARDRIGFDKNPFSFLFDRKIKHDMNSGKHETERNQELIAHLAGNKPAKPRLYPGKDDEQKTISLKSNPYICIAPGSVWFTKTFPAAQWISFIKYYHQQFPQTKIYLLGSPAETSLCEQIANALPEGNIQNLAGKLSILQSASLMRDAQMNFSNDSAPTHMASAMNAPVTVVFCSTIPAFGFGPLSDKKHLVETTVTLSCRPCGIHGFKSCPQGHFRCATTITSEQFLT